MAATYGWSVATVRELTDEQFVLVYLDSATERMQRDVERTFRRAVEATRMGTGFAHDAKAYRRWVGKQAAPKTAMSDEAIEAAIMRIGGMFPEHVERVTA